MVDIPRVKVHEDGRVALFLPGPDPVPGLTVSWFATADNPDGWDWLTDTQMSDPGWGDAAVVPLVEPANPVLAEIGEARITFGRIVCRRREIAADEARSLAQDLLSAAAWAERQAESC